VWDRLWCATVIGCSFTGHGFEYNCDLFPAYEFACRYVNFQSKSKNPSISLTFHCKWSLHGLEIWNNVRGRVAILRCVMLPIGNIKRLKAITNIN
jgi:hypothetical protein